MSNRKELLNNQKVVLFLINGLGDYILSMPSIRALFSLFQNITVISSKGAKDWFYYEFNYKSFVGIDVINSENEEKKIDVSNFKKKIPCDLFISLCSWHNESVDELIKLLQPNVTMGLCFNSFDHPKYLKWEQHSCDLAFEIPLYLDKTLSIKDFNKPLIFSPEYTKKAEEILSLLPRNKKKLVVHTETLSNKEWNNSKYITVINRFLEKNSDYIVLLIDINDRGLRAGSNLERIYPLNGFYFPTASEIIKRSNLFLGVDSCFMHVADICQIPGVVLFGPTKAKEWGYRFGGSAIHIEKEDMNQITENEVIHSLQLLEDKCDF